MRTHGKTASCSKCGKWWNIYGANVRHYCDGQGERTSLAGIRCPCHETPSAHESDVIA